MGITFRNPLKRRMSITSPIECITLPADRNNSALKKPCVNRWNMPAVTAVVIKSSPAAPAPSAMNM